MSAIDLPPSGHPILRRYWPWGVAGTMLLAGFLASLVFVSCDNTPVVTYFQQPVTTAGVPVMRVLVTPEAESSVTIGSTEPYQLLIGSQVVKSSTIWKLLDRPLTRRGDTWYFDGKPLGSGELLLTCPNGFVKVGGTRYRGEMLFVPRGEKLLAINYVDMESYLAGVLSKELYANWHEETYRTQAVAARSFALYQHDTFGKTHQYDLGSTQASQVYGGYDGETDRSRSAVQDTWGKVLVVGPAGAERSFLTQYSSTCGGTVNGAEVIRDANDIEPLRGGQLCTDCGQSPKYRWPAVRVKKSDIYRGVANAYAKQSRVLGGGVASVRVKDRTPYGRMMWVEVVGTSGKSITIRGEDLRLAIMRVDGDGGKLYSMNCDIRDAGSSVEFYNGKGFGHGVGLCQWGAQGKAQRGWTYEQILLFYYPGARPMRAY